MPTIDLADEEHAAVTVALKEKLDREVKYRMAPRMAPYHSALAKLDPSSVPKQLPERVPPPEAPARRESPEPSTLAGDYHEARPTARQRRNAPWRAL